MKASRWLRPWVLVGGAFVLGVLLGAGRIRRETRSHDGDGHQQISISIGLVNIHSSNLNDNARYITEEDMTATATEKEEE